MVFEGRDWTEYVLGLVRGGDATATLCLDGDVWVVDTEIGPTRTVMNVRVVLVRGGYRMVSAEEAA